MQAQLKPIAIVLLMAGWIAAPAMAATSQSKSLEASVARLEKEVASLKSQIRVKNRNQSNHQYHQVATTNTSDEHSVPQISKDIEYLPFDPDVPGQAFVSTGPYVGLELQFAGSNLIINSPSVNTDAQLLSIRKKILNQLHVTRGASGTTPTHSHLLFSGVIESQANYTNHGGGPSTTDIDLTNVSFDATIFGPSEWILGFIEFSYDNGAPLDTVFQSSSHYRTANSRVFVNKAFVTLGNFTCSPFYTSFGQFYVPFGTYSSVMVSDPLTKLLARTKARSILVGFQQQDKNAFYGAAYVFRGDSHNHSVATVDNGGLNFGYKFGSEFIHGNVGGGWIANIADSGGMQFGTGFHEYEQIVHKVAGYNARATLSLGEHIDFIGEYVTAANRFNPADMSYNGHGAKPNAYDLEAAYSFPILDNKPSSIGIGYAKTSQSLAMGLPLTRTSIVLNTSLMRNTLQSLEFRHDRQYAASAVATGAGDTPSRAQTGKADNAVTAQFDYYF
ncbi:MAG: LbtU family siderophore porin [Gammaproteobacteria bacterium]|nr:LbtU family siderophore porin [Gammaproteobacteria bacterium]MCW5582923.1 LbtU family siderophore porin [Gammaproteobacteria bacterium]